MIENLFKTVIETGKLQMSRYNDAFSWRQIKKDGDSIISLLPQIQQHGSFSIMNNPFLSLYCYEAFKYIENQYNNDVQGNDGRISLENIRLKTKIFEDKYSASKKMILNIDTLQDEIFKFGEVKSKLLLGMIYVACNHYNNIGLYFTEDEKIVGNTHYGYYVFQEDNLLKSTRKEIIRQFKNNKKMFIQKPNEFYNYGIILGQKVSDLVVTLGGFFDTNLYTSHQPINIKNVDYNTSVLFSEKDDNFKSVVLYLLHTLSTINFVLYVLDNGINNDGWTIRIKYIVMHYAHNNIITLKRHLEQNKVSIDVSSLFVTDILDESYISSRFRSCMMHYDFYNDKGDFEIEDKFLDDNKILFGLIESCFDGIDNLELNKNLTKKLKLYSSALSGVIERYFSIENGIVR